MDKRDGFCHLGKTLTVQTCTFQVSSTVITCTNYDGLLYPLVMAFVTYILLSTLLAGLRGAFQPELLGYTATWAFFIVFIEILGLKLGCYLLSISNESQLLDLVAYSGYKFVGVIVTLVVSGIFNGGEGTGGWIGWTI